MFDGSKISTKVIFKTLFLKGKTFSFCYSELRVTVNCIASYVMVSDFDDLNELRRWTFRLCSVETRESH